MSLPCDLSQTELPMDLPPGSSGAPAWRSPLYRPAVPVQLCPSTAPGRRDPPGVFAEMPQLLGAGLGAPDPQLLQAAPARAQRDQAPGPDVTTHRGPLGRRPASCGVGASLRRSGSPGGRRLDGRSAPPTSPARGRANPFLPGLPQRRVPGHACRCSSAFPRARVRARGLDHVCPRVCGWWGNVPVRLRTGPGLRVLARVHG